MSALICPECRHPTGKHVGAWCRTPVDAVHICGCSAVAAPLPVYGRVTFVNHPEPMKGNTMGRVKVQHTVSITSSGSRLTLADLADLIAAATSAGLDQSATVAISSYAGDQRDPGYTTLTVSAS